MRRILLLFAAILLLSISLRAQSLSVPIIVQPAEWNGQEHAVTGTRANAPVTFGLGIPDSAAIGCPGNQSSPQNEGSPTNLALFSGSTQLTSQFRCTGRWPDGHAEWVLVDAQLPSFAEGTPGYDTTITVKQVSSSGGNETCVSGVCSAATNMAVQCTGSGTPVAACPDSNHIVVNTGAATFLIKIKNITGVAGAGFNLFDDVLISGTHLVLKTNHGANDGLYLQGPPDSALSSGTIDSVSCVPTANGTTALAGSSGPVPTNYAGTSLCNTGYLAANDPNATAVIEENGSLRSVIMVQGDLVNSSGVVTSSGHIYQHFRVRMTFWANHSDAKVTVALRNADVVTPNVQSFGNGYKEYSQFEARLTDNLGAPSARNYDIATAGGFTTATGFASTQSTYLFQGYSTDGLWPHWNDGANCKLEGDDCVVSYIARTPVSAHIYALDGYQVNQNSTTPSLVGPDTAAPTGWADLDDGTNGIEIGVYQMPMYWPKSLEFQPGNAGHTSNNELRIGIWPDQQLAISPGTTFGTNTIQNPGYTLSAGCTPPGTNCNSQPITSYVTGSDEYAIHDLYFNFHSGTLSSAAAQQDFLYFQHYLLARPQSGTYYNTVRDSGSGFDAFFYDIPDPVQEDTLYKNLGLCSTAPGSCLPDVGQTGYPYGGLYGPGMNAFRFFIWEEAGGSDGTQFEQREAFLRNWLQRGGATTTGSTPGRYIFASHWYRMVVEKSLPRSDTASTSGSSAGFRQFCTSLTVCASLGYTAWGDPRQVNLMSATSVWNGGMRNWGDSVNSMEHSVYWGIFDYYHLSGDEFVREQLLQGFKDRYENPFVAFNNTQAGGSGAPGHGHINGNRAVGHHLSGMAREADFLCTIGDPDCDTSTTVLTVPGAGPGSTTPLQSALNIIASQVAIPLISGGYPVGFTETTAANCQVVGNPENLCSQGISPLRGTPKTGGSQLSCTPGGWIKNHLFAPGAEVIDSHGNIETTAGGGTSNNTGAPSWNGLIGGTTSDGSITWTNQGVAVAPCNNITGRAALTFQISSEAEGIYDTWLEMRKVLGANWHLQVGSASRGSPIIDGATSLTNVLVSEKSLTDAVYGISQHTQEEACPNTGVYSTSGCVYAQFLDYLNAPSPPVSSPGPGCTASGNCLRDCSSGCNGLTQWFAIAGQAATTNSIADLAGNPWQFMLNSQLQNSGIISQELGSQMMEFGVNYAIANGTTSGSASLFPLSGSVASLKSVPLTVTSCTGSCTHTATSCANTSSSMVGSCTITWTPPSGLCTIGTNCPPNGAPNGTQYRLKYWYCTPGTLTIFGNDCMAGGKAIVPTLGFHSDITTAGVPITQTQPCGSGPCATATIGSTVLDPAHNQNWFASIDVPDCGNGTSTSGCNSAAVSGTSYTFTTQPNSQYNFYLAAYATAASATYYISKSLGSDSNTAAQAKSKSTPWAHAPGMASCTASCAGYTPQPGDTFVFYGCDRWTSSDVQWVIPTSGASGSSITYGGEDPTWFNASACAANGSVNTFATPLDDGANVRSASESTLGFTPQMNGKTVTINSVNYTVTQVISATNMIVTPSPGTQSGVTMATSGIWGQPVIDFGNTLVCTAYPATSGTACAGINANNQTNVVIDNFDLRGFRYPNCNVGVCAKGNVIANDGAGNVAATNTGITESNNFVHDMDVSAGTVSGEFGSGTALGGLTIASNTCSQLNSPGGVIGGTCFFPSAAATNNVCYWAADCFAHQALGATLKYNLIYDTQTSPDPSDLGSAIHAECASYAIGNIIFNLASTMPAIVNEPSGGCPVQPQTYYSANNVLFGLGSQTCFVDRDYLGATVGTPPVNVSYVHYNDTCVPPGASGINSYAVRVVNDSGAGCLHCWPYQETAINLHEITANPATAGTAPYIGFDSGASPAGGSTVTSSANQTPASAAAQGYAATRFFAPPNTSALSVTTSGMNQISNCAGPLASLCTALSPGNPFGLALGAGGAARPSVGAWNVGAYQLAPVGTVTLTPASYGFAATLVGSNSSDSPVNFTLTNSSGATITISSIAASANFSQTATCGSSLANGASCIIDVTFTPAAVGALSGTLTVAYAGASGSPQISVLSGTGIASVITSPNSPVTVGP